MPGGGSTAACCSSTRSRRSRARSRRCSRPSSRATAAAGASSGSPSALVITLGLALLALVHDALPRDRGPRRGHARACSGAACAPSRATASARSTSPRARCTGSSGSPASRSAPGARIATRAAACGSTASPRSRPPRCASELLHRPRQAPPRRRRQHAAAGARPPRRPRRSPRPSSRAWTRAGSAYAPFTLSGLVSVGVVLGFLLNVANEAHFDPENWGPTRHLADRLGHAPVVLTAVVVAVLALVAIVVASTVGYALAFWDFRLTRHPGGTLHVSRGLITTRATTIEERRLHGAEVSEPLLLRMVAGARLIAIATGLRVGRGAERGGSLLVPARAARRGPARGRRGHRGPPSRWRARSPPHGPRARRAALHPRARRAGRCSSPRWRSSTGRSAARRGCRSAALALLPVAARARRRPLPQPRPRRRPRPPGRRAAARSCAGAACWRAEGIIGWNVERSFFQRRAGLATLTATTAAGHQHYDVHDVEIGEALRVAEELLPGLAEPFLERRPGSGAPVRQQRARPAAPPEAGPPGRRTRA